ncbi:class I SAM-dependent DNA methyltransferase [Albibacterium bauzanense]|uniref:site-specific DNA-methyltransferase (adenine-specific) n=1 Tax=Albibacterium bauzanense TaxID=653929 RepID=A0A4R1LZV2_9SPHI|nr:DNA methyltransferase [Albibacterium bauzanense]TCK82903.1 type II restriction/modification system DNA methylase subunit YeeA [Albibacterium bauzanense]
MNIFQIEKNIEGLMTNFDEETFVYDFLLAYGTTKAAVKRLKDGGLNLSKQPDELLWKKKLHFKESKEEKDLYSQIEDLKLADNTLRHQPRFIIVTDYKKLLAIDTKTKDSLDIAFNELNKHFDFFLPLAGMEKATYQNENPADVKAAEKMARLYDEILKDNPTQSSEEVHALNVFLSRILFCFFAEDTDIFSKSQFTNALTSHTREDGNDLQTYFEGLFQTLNTKDRKDLPSYFEKFPYVNGGLFRENHPIPIFTRRSRQAIIDSGSLDWSAINPDIFGSMIQAVITPEHRGGLGMHYTSVPNIMKVIEPLFLDELKEVFEKSKANKNKLEQLLIRLTKIKVFDPACGSGNFLIIAYKELRKLEMKIIKQIDKLTGQQSMSFSRISLNQFYGIELDDFAHEIASLSLWLAEHQMNVAFFNEFGRSTPALPLKDAGEIVHGNATRLDWEDVCPKTDKDEIYLLGNPPYKGFSQQDKSQKEDLFRILNSKTKLDYIACWFIKGAEYILNFNIKMAFVSTNSICQGEQATLLWADILKKNVEINFAFQSFKWANNAKSKAAVICVIVGLRNISKEIKVLYKGMHRGVVKNINPYLIDSDNVFIQKRTKPLSSFPLMVLGNMPYDRGILHFSEEEYRGISVTSPESIRYLKKIVGSQEYINGFYRYCIWIENEQLNDAMKNDLIRDRIIQNKETRLLSIDSGVRKLATKPHQFREMRVAESHSLILPGTSSERRDYIPVGYLDNDTIINNLAFAIYDPSNYILAIVASRMHMTWVRTVAGRLKSDYRYSSVLCYNTFPFPKINDSQKQELEKHTYRILEEREKHSEKTLAQLYDPDKMPEGLREAHHQNDLAVERCYRSKPFESDEERLEYLFKLYEKMIAEEEEKNTLFAKEKKSKKGRK